MSDFNLCPHCKLCDLSGWNEKNKERHFESCKKKNPYPRSKPLKQKKLGFLPVPVLPPQVSIDPPLDQVADPEVIEHDEDHDEIALNSPASQEPEVTEADELSEQEDDGIENIPCLQLNDDEEVVLVESSSNVVSACLGFRPDVENFYQNFAF